LRFHFSERSTQTAPIVENLRRSTFLQKVKTEKQLTCCTGLANFPGFESLCLAVKYYLEVRNKKEDSYSLDAEGRVFLTLMKLKLNCSFVFLGLLFDCSDVTCSRYFREMVKILSCVLKNFIYQPPRDSIRRNIPKVFKPYLNTRIILDCTKFPVYSPACITCRTQTYSFYYGRLTLKVLIGITPDGLISFVSVVYGGKASDSFIFRKSNVIDACDRGDAVMVDKGFRIDAVCAKRGVQVIQPPFKWRDTPQFSPEDCVKNSAIARARVHVERVNERIKNFKIFHDEISWNIVKDIDDILTIVCALVNLSAPVISDEKFL